MHDFEIGEFNLLCILWAFKFRKIITLLKIKSNIGLHTCMCIYAAVYFTCDVLVWLKFAKEFKFEFKLDLKIC